MVAGCGIVTRLMMRVGAELGVRRGGDDEDDDDAISLWLCLWLRLEPVIARRGWDDADEDDVTSS